MSRTPTWCAPAGPGEGRGLPHPGRPHGVLHLPLPPPEGGRPGVRGGDHPRRALLLRRGRPAGYGPVREERAAAHRPRLPQGCVRLPGPGRQPGVHEGGQGDRGPEGHPGASTACWTGPPWWPTAAWRGSGLSQLRRPAGGHRLLLRGAGERRGNRRESDHGRPGLAPGPHRPAGGAVLHPRPGGGAGPRLCEDPGWRAAPCCPPATARSSTSPARTGRSRTPGRCCAPPPGRTMPPSRTPLPPVPAGRPPAASWRWPGGSAPRSGGRIRSSPR